MIDLPNPPYPHDTRAKGWRFELDYEKIKQSDTWDLAGEIQMAQPALLMMWLVAWQQEPCGSLPDDEAVIRAKTRIPLAQWSKMRDVLMRGWWRARDGRMYHKTLTERVEEMMKRRRSDADRQHTKRLRELSESAVTPVGVTTESRVTPTGVGSESSTDNRQLIREKEIPPTPAAVASGRVVHGFPPGFDRFWSAYPRKAGKDAAARAFAKRKPDAALLAAMIAAVAAQRLGEPWRKDGGQFIPHPATWLNEGRWMDESEPPGGVSPELNDMFRRGSQ